MANPEHLAILKQGVEVWNEWVEKNFGEGPERALTHIDLRHANLTSADLRGIDLGYANLYEANLSHAKLDRADLSSAILIQADLSYSRLGSVNFFNSDLSEATLKGAYLAHAAIDGANLENTDLSEAEFMNTNLTEVNLSTAKGLDTVQHLAPSTIGIDTFYKSQGIIPDIFLRGCGVPETFITYARSIVGKPIDFYSCFISHSSKDKRFCERLYADLQANAVRVWYFPEDAKWGESVWGEIDRSIKRYDKLIVVCSKNSLTSGPVLREIERALNREDKECKNVLFPITIDRYIFDEWQHPRKDDVLAKVVGTDFVGWNRDASEYDKAFKKLLKALKAG